MRKMHLFLFLILVLLGLAIVFVVYSTKKIDLQLEEYSNIKCGYSLKYPDSFSLLEMTPDEGTIDNNVCAGFVKFESLDNDYELFLFVIPKLELELEEWWTEFEQNTLANPDLNFKEEVKYGILKGTEVYVSFQQEQSLEFTAMDKEHLAIVKMGSTFNSEKKNVESSMKIILNNFKWID